MPIRVEPYAFVIIGVVANVLKQGNDAVVQPEHYQVPHAPMRFFGHVEIALHTACNPSALAPAVRAAVQAVALASVGVYGVLSYGVSQRRRELGVRAALGAAKGDLVALVVREGLTVTAIGLAVGLLGAAALTRFMQGVLFGVAPLDVLSFIAAPIVLAVVAVAACLLPASRAASTDPAEALRCE